LAHNEENQAKSGFRYNEHGVPIFDRLSEIEREQTKAKERDEKYKGQQLVLNKRMARFTLALVLVSAATGGISIWQASIARRSANRRRELPTPLLSKKQLGKYPSVHGSKLPTPVFCRSKPCRRLFHFPKSNHFSRMIPTIP
jgi:hypothetical protein